MKFTARQIEAISCLAEGLAEGDDVFVTQPKGQRFFAIHVPLRNDRCWVSEKGAICSEQPEFVPPTVRGRHG